MVIELRLMRHNWCYTINRVSGEEQIGLRQKLESENTLQDEEPAVVQMNFIFSTIMIVKLKKFNERSGSRRLYKRRVSVGNGNAVPAPSKMLLEPVIPTGKSRIPTTGPVEAGDGKGFAK